MSDYVSASPDLNGDHEISFLDIVNFLTDSWKKLAIAALVGAALGLAGWFVLGSYSAEYVLLNNTQHKTQPTNRQNRQPNRSDSKKKERTNNLPIYLDIGTSGRSSAAAQCTAAPRDRGTDQTNLCLVRSGVLVAESCRTKESREVNTIIEETRTTSGALDGLCYRTAPSHRACVFSSRSYKSGRVCSFCSWLGAVFSPDWALQSVHHRHPRRQ